MEHEDYFEGGGGNDDVEDGADITQDDENTANLRREVRDDYEGKISCVIK